MTLSFLNVWDVHYQGSVLGVEWTVPIEMWTYLIIPPLFFFLKKASNRTRWLAFTITLVIALLDSKWHREWLGAHWAIEPYLYCFFGGIIAYCYWEKVSLTAHAADILVIVLLIAALFPMGGGHTLELWYTLLFMALILVLSVAQRTRILFENRLIVFIGNISFPFYLIPCTNTCCRQGTGILNTGNYAD